MLTRSDSLRIRDQLTSRSTRGCIGLYRSSDNTIVGNRIDFDVRGYSHGFYRRGQDSAGLLFFEQSSRNVVAFNSATHGGDGFFLWASQSTMDTGEGGANDNVLYANDFGFADQRDGRPSVAMRFCATAPKGRLRVMGRVQLRIDGGWELLHQKPHRRRHRAWQDSRIVSNRFHGDSLAISLWGVRSSLPTGATPSTATRARLSRENNVFAGTISRFWRRALTV